MPKRLHIQASAENRSQNRQADKLLRGKILFVLTEGWNLAREVNKNAGVEVSVLAKAWIRLTFWCLDLY